MRHRRPAAVRPSTARRPGLSVQSGAPIATGDPAQIGISDLSSPDWGESVDIKDGEIPVYWACGVTPQNVLLDAGLPICITHSPGHMLIANVAEDAETTILK